jgi:Anthranilate synthase component I, N terminal region
MPLPPINLQVQHRQGLADAHTPMGVYRRIRDHVLGSILLESTDVGPNGERRSYIALRPQAMLRVVGPEVHVHLPHTTPMHVPLAHGTLGHMSRPFWKFSA